MSNDEQKSKRGFASMDPEKQRAIASRGGIAAHEQGRAHEFAADSEEARRAGRLGGKKIASNRAHMSAIGKLGGQARGRARQRAATPED
jgi:general stress protein YciG